MSNEKRDEERLRDRFEAAGQGHVFRFWEALDSQQRGALLAQLETVDLQWLARRVQHLKEEEGDQGVDLRPAPVLRLPGEDVNQQAAWQEARQRGEDALSAGRVAAFVVAGGQGTRLGFEGPKGAYAIGPCTQRTLFQVQAEQIRALTRRHGRVIPWYLMTSPANHQQTQDFFEANQYFGLDPDDMKFFTQQMVPSVDLEGKLLLESPSSLVMSPNGHGGSLLALVQSGAVADMKRRGIQTISYFQVDNPLVTICDPTFLGHHLKAGAPMSSKVLEKAGPEEKVGVICLQQGRTAVVEYSDLDRQLCLQRDPRGGLVYWAGSIAIHMVEVDFVEQIGSNFDLPYHKAKKKIRHLDKEGNQVNPSVPNGYRFETFVFDALPRCEVSVTMEVRREEEFAPVKNAEGVDSPASCRSMLSEFYAAWLEQAGIPVPRDASGHLAARIEISPLDALDSSDLLGKAPSDIPTLRIQPM